MKTWIWIMVFLGMGNLVTSQSNDLGKWYGYSIDKNLNQTINLSVLLQFRESGIYSVQDKYLVLNKLGFHPQGKKYAFSIYHYTLQTNENNDSDNISPDFNFLGQEIAYFHAINKLSISHKLRLEQVWKENASFYQQSRLFTSIKMPLLKESDKLLLVFSTDIFWQLDSFSFYRNRMFFGFSMHPIEHFKFTIGFMQEKYIDKNQNYLNITINQRL